MGEIIVYGIVAFVILGIVSMIITWIIENWVLALCIAIVIFSGLIFLALKLKKISREEFSSSENNSRDRPSKAAKFYNPNLGGIADVVPQTYTNWNLDLLNDLEWKRFEEVVSDYYRLVGYRSEVTRMGADGGVDVLLYQQEGGSPIIIIQCKSWSQKVGVKAIRELYGVMAADGVGYGIFATTSDYTNEAKEWVQGKNMQLLSGSDLVCMFNQLPEEHLNSHLENGLGGDFSTPTCPNCNQKMVKRTASKGKSAGSSFWGCANYPRCKQTFKMV